MKHNLPAFELKHRAVPIPVWPALSVILLQYITIGRPQDVFAVIRYLRPGVISISLLLLLAILYWKKISGPGLFESLTVRRFRNLLILMVIVAPISVIPNKSIFYLLSEFCFAAFYFFCFYKFIRTPRLMRASIIVLILSSFFLSLPIIINSTGADRLSVGTYYDPNDIALLFVSILPFAVFFLQYEKGTVRIISLVSVIFSITALGFTQSRGGFFGLLIVFLVWVFQANTYMKQKNILKKIFVGVILAAISFQFIPSEVIDRFQSIQETDMTGSGRLTVWPRAIQMMVWHPLGVGAGNFTSAYGRHLSNGDFQETEDDARERAWMTAHNSYLLVGAELGIIGLVLYLLWLLGMLKTLNRLQRIISEKQLSDQLFRYCAMVRLALIGFMIPAFFLSQSFAYILLTIAGYVSALDFLVTKELNVNEQQDR